MIEIISSIRSRLSNNHVVVLVDKTWVFDAAIHTDLPIWPVVDQIFFKNNPRVQNLIFAVPCWIGEFRIDSLLSEESYLRLLVIHGPDLSLLIRAVNQFMAMYTQVVAKVIPKNQEWTGEIFQKTINAALKGRYQFKDVLFFRYEKAHHYTLPGQWHAIKEDQSISELPQFLTNKNRLS
jgi:hypothetical protein